MQLSRVGQSSTPREGMHAIEVLKRGSFVGYSTKQNPHGVFLIRSRPMMIRFTSPHMENSSYTCSSLEKKDMFPAYSVELLRSFSSYSSVDSYGEERYYAQCIQVCLSLTHSGLVVSVLTLGLSATRRTPLHSCRTSPPTNYMRMRSKCASVSLPTRNAYQVHMEIIDHIYFIQTVNYHKASSSMWSIE